MQQVTLIYYTDILSAEDKRTILLLEGFTSTRKGLDHLLIMVMVFSMYPCSMIKIMRCGVILADYIQGHEARLGHLGRA